MRRLAVMPRCFVVGLVGSVWLAGASMAVAQAYSDDDIEEARQAAHFFKEKYWTCLAEEAVRMLSTKLSVDDFRSYLPGVCAKQKEDFRVPFVDYAEMQFPEMTLQDHLATFSHVVQAAIDDAVTGFIRARNGID